MKKNKEKSRSYVPYIAIMAIVVIVGVVMVVINSGSSGSVAGDEVILEGEDRALAGQAFSSTSITEIQAFYVRNLKNGVTTRVYVPDTTNFYSTFYDIVPTIFPLTSTLFQIEYHKSGSVLETKQLQVPANTFKTITVGGRKIDLGTKQCAKAGSCSTDWIDMQVAIYK